MSYTIWTGARDRMPSNDQTDPDWIKDIDPASTPGTGIFVVPGVPGSRNRIQAIPDLTYDLTRQVGRNQRGYKWVPNSVQP